ncbi:putative transmembrane protein [Sesbania bispinosa]|nr:putative transmembrane protein [Sesbania bispinosa]
MASPFKFTMLAACLLILVVVAAGQYGGDGSGMPGMAMGPAPGAPPPSASPRSLSYSAGIIIFLPLMLTFLVAKQSI